MSPCKSRALVHAAFTLGGVLCSAVEGDPHVKIDGHMAAFEGHKISCGATPISSVPTSGRS